MPPSPVVLKTPLTTSSNTIPERFEIEIDFDSAPMLFG
jgi:hypothetical protein